MLIKMAKLLRTLGALVLALSGCSGKKLNKPQEELTTLVGEPVSIESDGGRLSSSLSVIVKTEDGKYILCNKMGSIRTLTNAAAVIRSEMNDGDNEPVVLKGKYDVLEIMNSDEVFKRFKIYSVSANGFTIDVTQRYKRY